jgi:type IV pilus biogenesis protein CpaD/CtpE
MRYALRIVLLGLMGFLLVACAGTSNTPATAIPAGSDTTAPTATVSDTTAPSAPQESTPTPESSSQSSPAQVVTARLTFYDSYADW